jgi:aminoglycoside phosphotransferase (APT) family kinase protein
MSTIGDPLFDFSGVLAYWRDGSDPGNTPTPGLDLPNTDAAIERYASRTGFAVDDIGWYHAFAVWKVAIIRQQLANRYARGQSNDPRLASFGDGVPASGERALALLEGRA